MQTYLLFLKGSTDAYQFNRKEIKAIECTKLVLNERDSAGNLTVCIPAQVLIEFLNVITWAKLESPLPLPAALRVVQQYMDTGVTIMHPLPSQLDTLLELLATVKTRKKIFDSLLQSTTNEKKPTQQTAYRIKPSSCKKN